MKSFSITIVLFYKHTYIFIFYWPFSSRDFEAKTNRKLYNTKMSILHFCQHCRCVSMCCTAINGIKCTCKCNSVAFQIFYRSEPARQFKWLHTCVRKTTWTRKRAVADERGRERRRDSQTEQAKNAPDIYYCLTFGDTSQGVREC